MSENLQKKFAVFGGDLSRKLSQRMNSMGDKMKELFQGSNQAERFVEDATPDQNGASPDWGKNLQICDMVNTEGISGQDVVRAVKKRLTSKNSPTVQFLALVLLETCVKNCDKMFAEVASEKVLDEMVKIVDDPMTARENRDKVLKMIEAWGEATEELRYLPVYEETYKSLKSRGIRFPGRDEESLAPIFTPPQSVPITSHNSTPYKLDDPKEVFNLARNSCELLSTVLSSAPQKEVLKDDLTTTLVEQCRQAQVNVQKLLERLGEDESAMFEGLQVNDELQKVLNKYEEMSKGGSTHNDTPTPAPAATHTPARAFVPAEEEEEAENESLVRSSKQNQVDKLDDMIFGKKGTGSNTKNDDNLITF